MPAYDADSFEPPAPVVNVSVRSQAGRSIADVPMLIDTGADVSLLPATPVQTLLDAIETVGQYELEAFNGTRSFAEAVQLELHFLGKVFRGQFLVIEQSYGILGRNVLNSLPLLLDGPNLMWAEHR